MTLGAAFLVGSAALFAWGLGLGAACGLDGPGTPWATMWALLLGLFGLVKGAVWWEARPHPRDAPDWRHAAFLGLWPGMDARRFLDPRRVPAPGVATDLAWGALHVALGAALGLGAWHLPTEVPLWIRGALGTLALGFVLFFGLFRLLTALWRSQGVDVSPQWRTPACATSPSDFWSRRWNRAFHRAAMELLVRPLRGRLPPGGVLALVFLASGLAHEVVLSVPAGGGYGAPTLYFAIQGLAVAWCSSDRGRSGGWHQGWRGWSLMAVTSGGAVPLLFHPPFLTQVVAPVFVPSG